MRFRTNPLTPTNSNPSRSVVALLLLCCLAPSLMAQRDRIAGAITNARRAPLTGHVHPLARAEFDRGPADPSMAMPELGLVLKPSASQQSDLDQLLAAQQDPASPDYHHWLTPEEYADRFGASPDDISKITQWLNQQGFHVTGVARARNWISFNGTAG